MSRMRVGQALILAGGVVGAVAMWTVSAVLLVTLSTAILLFSAGAVVCFQALSESLGSARAEDRKLRGVVNDVAGTVGRQAPVVRRIDDRTRALLAAQASAALGAERDETVLLATDSAAARADVGGRRRRLVIAGDDLKFVRPLLPVLERDWEVRVDQWTGPEGHDVELSEELADWADVVWCEWWLGNAVWYSWRLRPEQRLLVRLHLFELGREYLDLTNLDAVDRVVCVSLPMLMELRQRVVLPRGVERVVPNAVAFPPQPPLVETGRDEATSSSKPMNRRYSLALVGGVPARKGLRRAVEVLGALHREDPRYRLDIYGRRADELPGWRPTRIRRATSRSARR